MISPGFAIPFVPRFKLEPFTMAMAGDSQAPVTVTVTFAEGLLQVPFTQAA